jgi:hypothetical protein
MRFSERKGYKPVSETVQTQGMSENLRNSLWNVLDIGVWQERDFLLGAGAERTLDSFSKILWFRYFKQPVDSRPGNQYHILKAIREYFFTCEWYEVYDFLEFTLGYFGDTRLYEFVNAILERELSGYRFINGTVTDITDQQEVEMLQDALSDEDFPAVKAHLRRALELLSNRENPDYRNSIKESISAVESIARVTAGNPKATLGDALKAIERTGKIHPSLKEAFSKLYGYTSDEGGIRHSMLEEPNLSAADAKFFLLSCTSFINYLKAKM